MKAGKKRSGVFVFCVIDSSPEVFKFKTVKQAKEFIKDFYKRCDGADGYWVDYLMDGSVINYEGQL